METRAYTPAHDGRGQTYLVTGGEGMLGRYLVEALAKHRPAAEIRVFARKQSFFDDPPNVVYALGDLADPPSIQAACQGVTTIFHAAALLSEDTKAMQRVNVDGTKHLLDAARQLPQVRVINVGTVSAVVNHAHLWDGDETLPFADNPCNPYMTFKAEAERLVMAWGREHQRPVCTLRPPLLFGRGDRNMAPKLLAHAKSPFARTCLGKGSVTNVMYAANAAYALLMAEERLSEGSPVDGEVFNVHDGMAINLYEMGRDLYRTIGLPHADTYLTRPMPMLPVLWFAYLLDWISRVLRPVVQWRPPLLPHEVILVELCYTFSIEKAKRVLQWAPVISYQDALQQIRPWLQQTYDRA